MNLILNTQTTQAFTHHLSTNDWLGMVFLLGLVLVYSPQFYKMIRMRTSRGFSPWFLFMGYTASLLAWNNALIFYKPAWMDCQGAFNCTEHILGFGLIFLQWLLYLFQYILYMVYLPKLDESRLLLNEADYLDPYLELNSENLSQANPDHQTDQADIRYLRRISKLTFWASHLIGAICLACTFILFAFNQWKATAPPLQHWSTVIGSMISLMFLAHYLPQIYETYRLKRTESMSLVTLGMMCPGTFLWTYFLATQDSPVDKDAGDPKVWVPYLFVGFMQTILLYLGIYYEYGDQIKQKWRQFRTHDQEEEILNI